MKILQIILPILVGSVIGYFTNGLAIKMLFRPHRAVYIGKHKLPFTPGIIPKNQKRLAGAIGDAVSEQLLTKDAVLQSFGETGERYMTKVVEQVCGSDRSIVQMLPEGTDSPKMIESASGALASSIIGRIRQTDIDAVIEQFGNDALASLRSTNPVLGLLLNAGMKQTIYARLSGAVRRYLDEHGEEKAHELIRDYISDYANRHVEQLLSKEGAKERFCGTVENLVRNEARKHGPELVEQLDIRGIIVERIESMDVAELEELVMSVMRTELQAVVSLGALIGAVIGVINIFI